MHEWDSFLYKNHQRSGPGEDGASEVHHGLERFHGNDSGAGSKDGCDNGQMADKEMTFVDDASALSTSEDTEQLGGSMKEAANPYPPLRFRSPLLPSITT